MGLIAECVEAARRDLERRRAEVPLAEIERRVASSRGEDRPFMEAMLRQGMSLIAEFKRRSPAAGEIRPGARPAEIVKAYEAGGAAAVSILTEGPHFGGSLDDLREAREATSLPILRKDFVVDPYMVYEAAAAGADAILLIVAAVDERRLAELYREATALDLDCLVEVHTEEELERALELEAEAIGINNRNLDTLAVDIRTTFDLLSSIPAGKAAISESGLSGRAAIEECERVGVDGVLVGESLMRAADSAEACRTLLGAVRP